MTNAPSVSPPTTPPIAGPIIDPLLVGEGELVDVSGGDVPEVKLAELEAASERVMSLALCVGEIAMVLRSDAESWLVSVLQI